MDGLLSDMRKREFELAGIWKTSVLFQFGKLI